MEDADRKTPPTLIASTNAVDRKNSNTELGSYTQSRKPTMRSYSQAPQVARVNIRDMMEQIMARADQLEESKTKHVSELTTLIQRRV